MSKYEQEYRTIMWREKAGRESLKKNLKIGMEGSSPVNGEGNPGRRWNQVGPSLKVGFWAPS
jgi:hypothetical protein